MIVKQAAKVIYNFTRLARPNLSRGNSIFDILKDRSTEIKILHSFNQKILRPHRAIGLSKVFAEELSISQKNADIALNTVINSHGYSPVSSKHYTISQKLDGHNLQIREPVGKLEIPYSANKLNLKQHYSINKEVPQILQYQFNGRNIFLFNLPDQITEDKLASIIGQEKVKKVKIEYSVIGLPAFANIQFVDNETLKKFIAKKKNLQENIEGRVCYYVPQDSAEKLQLNRRQIVIKGIHAAQSPGGMLKSLSAFGKIMHFDFPLNVYRQPTLKQIKQMYKNQSFPIILNYHRINGTTQSQYYPPFSPEKSGFASKLDLKQAQYKRRMNYSENIHVYEGKEGEKQIKTKGFCIVTFSCQDQAKNCYLQLQTLYKMQLVNNRQQFEFDEKHRQQLLRFIDHSYIQKSQLNQIQQQQDYQKLKQNKPYFQSIYLQLVHENFYRDRQNKNFFKTKDSRTFDSYRNHINTMKQSIGVGNINPGEDFSNVYGKSFDQLAEQELYGRQLDLKKNSQRYQVNIDDFIDPSLLEKKQQQANMFEPIPHEKRRQKKKQKIGLLEKQQIGTEHEYEEQDQIPKRKFSTKKAKIFESRKKTEEQYIRSRMNYNRYVRDIVNQYMGIFSVNKFEQQLWRKPRKLVNLHNLSFLNGQQIIKEQEVQRVLMYSSSIKSANEFYRHFVKTNQGIKSLSVDVEEVYLKNFESNQARYLEYLTDVGIVKQQFSYSGDSIEKHIQELNIQSRMGEEYRAVQNEETGEQKILKINKLESIYPTEALKKVKINIKQEQKAGDFKKKMQLAEKYHQYLFNNKPIPDELAEAFGYQKNTILNPNTLAEQACLQLGISKKDIQKILNLEQYSDEQIKDDFYKQQLIEKQREKKRERTAMDYGKDPSKIITKDKNGKSIVSKFRQI